LPPFFFSALFFCGKKFFFPATLAEGKGRRGGKTSEKIKFQHKVCFIKFLFPHFIKHSLKLCSPLSENTLKSPKSSQQSSFSVFRLPLFLLYHQKIIKIEDGELC
jgi:hypothetical protein